MPVRAEDLPKKIRDQLGVPAKAGGQRPAGRSATGGGRWRCPRCPELGVLSTWSAVERHRDELGHLRFEIVLAS